MSKGFPKTVILLVTQFLVVYNNVKVNAVLLSKVLKRIYILINECSQFRWTYNDSFPKYCLLYSKVPSLAMGKLILMALVISLET